jgi:V8-like Glu-specific endopeptidase
MEDRDYIAVKERVADRLLAIPGVHAVGVGAKLTAGERTPATSIRVYVTQKRPLAEIPEAERVPPEIEGVKTDVVEWPIPTLQVVPGISVSTSSPEDSSEHRPLRGGTQITRNGSSGAGTLGCFCDVTGDASKIIALTAFHVVAETATDNPAHQLVGQPSGCSSSSATCDDIFGQVLDGQYDEDVDVALIQINGAMQYLAEMQNSSPIVIHGIGPHPAKNDPVTKRGATTELTGGFVDDISIDGEAGAGTPLARSYKRAIRIMANLGASPGPSDFTRPGDSGSAYLNAAGQVVAIHFAGTAGTGHSIGTPIETIVNKFNGVPIVPGGPTLPANRHIALSVSSASAAGETRTVAQMSANPQPERVALMPQAAQRLEEVRRSSQRGAWYADLFHRHGQEVADLVHKNRRVTVVWHRSGAAELVQGLVRAFTQRGVRVPEQIQGRPIRVCVEELAAALSRNGSSGLIADLRRALPTLPDLAGLTEGEIIERLRIEAT